MSEKTENYTLVNEQMVHRDSDGVYIPFDDDNRDYQQYKAWLDAGNTPNPAPPVYPTPPAS